MPIKSRDLLHVTKEYIAHLIRQKSPDSVRNTFLNLRLIELSNAFRHADLSGECIPATFLSEIYQNLSGHAVWRLHYVRHWYQFCADFGCERFSPDVAFELEAKTLGGNRKGHAVLSMDPEEGPLHDLEVTCLLNAMKMCLKEDAAPLREMAVLWLCIAFGSNPLQLALLREDDVEIIEADGLRFVQIRIPRVKKRTDKHRIEFRKRKLPQDIGNIILRLIAENRLRILSPNKTKTKELLPIFLRDEPRPQDINDPLVEYRWHFYSNEITSLVKLAVQRLAVVSPRTGRDLHVTCRRLRYTFATRLVREGASRHAVADALDHTDLQNVSVYFDIKSDIVDSLDRAMALALGPIAQAFLGKLVGGEADARRGDDPTSRIMTRDVSTGEARGLGTCGQHSFCRYLAPIACYTCHQFQPWMDGPHDTILRDLLTERGKRIAAGQDGRMATLHDATILAIGDVIARIETARLGAGS